MYIKQVIIQGFRSYKDQTVIEPFSPKHNVIVGRNGSGKSNFFYAIQFVLSDEFSHMRQEERHALLHEGTGSRVISAYVEIIFDNSDSRLPVDKEDVSLRRVIGSKKDQFFLDKKNVTKSDVMNLLESAGFSRSNPYYIVKQGKINQLATAKDLERLKLLREVAGTRVYDERKQESQVILDDTENKREKIEELLQYIEERLQTLQGEMEELKEYQKLDKDRRCIEYTIHEKELRTTRAKLEELETNREQGSRQSNMLQKSVEEAVTKVEEHTDKLKRLREKIVVLNEQKQQLDEEKRDHIKDKTKLELDIKDVEDSVREFRSSRTSHDAEIQELDRRIAVKQERLDTILPEYNQLKENEEQYSRSLRQNEQRREELFSKQGRNNQFSSREARDEWINNELRSLMTSISAKESQINGLDEDVRRSQDELRRMEGEIQERNDNMQQRMQDIEEANRNHCALRKNRDDDTNKRKELWREEAEVEETIQSLTEDLNKSERFLRSSVSKTIFNGIESVKTIVRENNIQGFYGPLIEIFTCLPKYNTAVEVTAGNKLFHMVVDTDKTATDLLKIMNRKKMPGSATFMPLNKMNARRTTLPEASEYFMMVDKLEYNPMFEKAMLTVFGKTLICQNIDVASQYAKSTNMDCVTMEGDQVSRRGALTGGYYDTRKSRLDSQRTVFKIRNDISTSKEIQEEKRSQLEQIDGVITNVLGDIQRLETKQIAFKETYERQKVEVKTKQKEMESKAASLKHKQQMLEKKIADLDAMNVSQRSLSSELGTELMADLNEEDQRDVDRLNEETRELQRNLRDVLDQRSRLETEKNKLENVLNNNLKKHREKLLQEMDEMTFEGREQQLESLREELSRSDHSYTKTTELLQNANIKVNEVTAKIQDSEERLETWKNKEKDRRVKLEEDSKSKEKNTSKRSTLVKKKDECVNKIRELGSLPTDAFEKYQATHVKALWKKLQRCNEDLKKFNHVNKKALDQFLNFSDQKERLMKRKDEVDKGREAILGLMDVLEQRKQEAILFTFKQVSYNFTAVFKELVPRGKANLVMKREDTPTTDDEGESSQSQASSSSQGQSKLLPSDRFSGVSIKVSFTGKSAETKEMNQLSGGQKSLVALGLIFAIQRCDPAPFYLFDEIDQALDPQYRTSVAAMIKNQAEKAQFITTTFRPELLEAADKFYGVRFLNKVSHINEIAKEAAKNFVEEDDQGR